LNLKTPAVVPLHVGGRGKRKMTCDLLLSEYGIYIQPISGCGSRRRRITMMRRSIASPRPWVDVWDQLKLPRQPQILAAE
jgi:hypothetical protein